MGILEQIHIKPSPSLSELEEKEEYLNHQRRVKEEEVAIKELNDRLGKGKWKLFSSDGSRKNFSLSKAIAWLRAH